MKRGTVVTVHKCVCCKTEYDTKAKAAACSKYKVSLKKGDLLTWNNRPWLVLNDADDTSFFSIERVDAFHKASGWASKQGKRFAIPTAYFCNSKPTRKPSLEDAERYLKERVAQLAAAEKWLKMVKQTYGDTNDKPRNDAKAPPLARRNDRPSKRVPKKSVRKPS